MAETKPFGHYLWVNTRVEYAQIAGIVFLTGWIGQLASGRPYFWMGGGLAVYLLAVRPLISALQQQKYDRDYDELFGKLAVLVKETTELADMKERMTLFQVPLQCVVDERLADLGNKWREAVQAAKNIAGREFTEKTKFPEDLRPVRQYQQDLAGATQKADAALRIYEETRKKFRGMGFAVSNLL